MSDLKFILRVSRPRFWIYVFGPYLVGLAAGISSREDLLRLDALIFAIFFLLPANLLIYGINDIFDWETDRLNPKKAEYETLLRPESHRRLAIWIAVLNLPFAVLTFFLAPQALPSLAGFVFFSVFYSAPPIRAKAIPIIDSAFNVLYVFPGALAYQTITGEFPPLVAFTAAWFWTMAMHAYSAIPDIDADREGGVSTVATLLGPGGTLVFCLACYLASAIFSLPYLGYASMIGSAIYAAMVAISFFSNSSDGIFSIYQRFPLVNAIVGSALFWYVAWPKFF
jgi:4-hydroxybenzoate polyprenyltransferase